MTFDEFLAARLPALLRYAVMLTGDPHLAEDVVQETMVRAHAEWGRVSRADLPDRYVTRMVTNTYLGWRRRAWFHRSVPVADGDRPPAVQPSGSPSGSQAVLVPAAGEVEPTLAVSPGWLPAQPEKTDATVRSDRATVEYQFGDGGRVRSVNISVSDGVPDLVVPPTDPSWTDVDVNGAPGRQRADVQDQGIRMCLLVWPDRARWLTVLAYDVGTTPSCAVGLQVARNLKRTPMALPRTVRIGLVPQGYTLAATGTTGETWCPPGTPREEQLQGCLTARPDPATEGLDGVAVTVRGRPSVLQRTEAEVIVYVRGYLWLEMPTPQRYPGATPVTDADLIRIAESVEIG